VTTVAVLEYVQRWPNCDGLNVPNVHKIDPRTLSDTHSTSHLHCTHSLSMMKQQQDGPPRCQVSLGTADEDDANSTSKPASPSSPTSVDEQTADEEATVSDEQSDLDESTMHSGASVGTTTNGNEEDCSTLTSRRRQKFDRFVCVVIVAGVALGVFLGIFSVLRGKQSGSWGW